MVYDYHRLLLCFKKDKSIAHFYIMEQLQNYFACNNKNKYYNDEELSVLIKMDATSTTVFKNILDLAAIYYSSIRNIKLYKYISNSSSSETFAEDSDMKRGFVIEKSNGRYNKIEIRENDKREGLAFYSMMNGEREVWIIAEFKNDKKNGFYIEFIKNGRLLKVEHFKNDHKDGWNVWYDDNDGKLRAEGMYKDDLRCGCYKTYHKNERIHLDCKYSSDNGHEVLMECKEWYDSGYLKHEGEYKNGEMEGSHMWYYDNKNGMECEDGDKKGMKWKQIFYYDGIPFSGAKMWNREGDLVKHSIFTNGIEKQIILDDGKKEAKSFYCELPYRMEEIQETAESISIDVLQIVDDKNGEMITESNDCPSEDDTRLERAGENVRVYPVEGGSNVAKSYEERGGAPLEYGIVIDKEERDRMNGSLLCEFMKRFNKEECDYVWKDDNGKIRMEMNRDDSQNDIDVNCYICKGYYSTGELLFYCGVKIVGDNSNGNRFILHGYYTQYYLNSHIRYLGLYVNGKREGIHRFYYEEGGIEYLLTYHDDKLNRGSQGYYKNGLMRFFVSYIEDVLEFKYAYYDENGKMREMVRILNGERQNVHMKYTGENEYFVEYYDHGVVNGCRTYFNKNVRYGDKLIPVGIETFKNGVKHGLSMEMQLGCPVEQNIFINGKLFYQCEVPDVISLQ